MHIMLNRFSSHCFVVTLPCEFGTVNVIASLTTQPWICNDYQFCWANCWCITTCLLIMAAEGKAIIFYHCDLVISLFRSRLFDRVDLIKPVSNVRPSAYVYMCVRTSVYKKFLRFQWNLACTYRSMSDARQYTVWPDPRSRSRAFKVGNPAIFKSYLLCHLQWELATDHWRLN